MAKQHPCLKSQLVDEQGQSNTLASGVSWWMNKGKQHPCLKSQLVDEQGQSNTLASGVSWCVNKGKVTPLPQESVGG